MSRSFRIVPDSSRSSRKGGRSRRAGNAPPTPAEASTSNTSSLGAYHARRDEACDALGQVADTWRSLDLHDELGWLCFAADLAAELEQLVRLHAVRARAALCVSPLRLADGSAEPGDSNQGARDTAASRKRDDAADAAVGSLLNLVQVLSPTDDSDDDANFSRGGGSMPARDHDSPNSSEQTGTAA